MPLFNIHKFIENNYVFDKSITENVQFDFYKALETLYQNRDNTSLK